MKTHLKSAIGSLALLACLSLSGALPAAAAAPQANVPPPPVVQAAVGPLAWQRVGAPISLDA